MIIQTISTILIIAMSGNRLGNYVLDRDNIIDANQTSVAKLDAPTPSLTDALKTKIIDIVFSQIEDDYS
ncbi:MAG: hypothetical protein LBF97_03155 [Elusimicrobiota bacterium]|jgi:hypothetical protein|nr:hypothetical protein [Elusimicrobiota bacterium]